MLKIVGYKESKGVFSDKATGKEINYDNVVFSFVTDENEDYSGLATELFGLNNIKIARTDLIKVIGNTSPELIKGKEVAIDWQPNKYGKLVIAKIRIVK